MGERLDVEELVEPEIGHHPVAPIEASGERVDAHRAEARRAQAPGDGVDRHPGIGGIGVEPVQPKHALRQAGQRSKLRAHGVGAIGWGFEQPVADGAGNAAVEVRQQVRRDEAAEAPRIEKRLELQQHDRPDRVRAARPAVAVWTITLARGP